ncbi:MAG: glutamine-synthetase adenylyltransferase, partial [Pseudomonadota bacterium]
MASADETGRAFSTIAEATIQVLTPRVVAEFSRRHGPPPGRGLAVIAMGKLGSGEMTASSDLDLITVYDPGTAESSTGLTPLAVSAYYPRLTQALVSALTVPTAEGRLYEVDMRLRPSGRQGPVAVSLDGFRRYQKEQAWVWEHMALTRARPIAGDPSLLAEIEGVITETLLARRGDPAVLTEGAEMRQRLLQATRGEVWDVKAPPGGLMEIEFIAQAGVLHAGCLGCRRADKALPKLAEAGWLTKDEAHHLADALMLFRQIQQIERAALETALNPEAIGPGLKSRLLATSDLRETAELAHLISQHRAQVTAIAERIFKQAHA